MWDTRKIASLVPYRYKKGYQVPLLFRIHKKKSITRLPDLILMGKEEKTCHPFLFNNTLLTVNDVNKGIAVLDAINRK